MQLLLVSASMLSNVKIDLPEWCKIMMPGKPNTLQKGTNPIKQKYMKLETAAQNLKNQLKSSIDYNKTEELKSQ